MPTLNIVEYDNQYYQNISNSVKIQNITFNNVTPIQSDYFSNNVSLIRLVSTENCWILFGTNPTATPENGIFLQANNAAKFNIEPGHRLSVIQSETTDTKIGNETDYVELSSTGLRLYGDATDWDDLDFAMSIRSQGPSAPALTQIGTTGIWAWTFTNGKEAFFQRQIPHKFKVGTIWHPHIHWMPTTSETYTGSFQLEYVWHSATSGALSSKVTQDPVSFNSAMTAFDVKLTSLPQINTTMGISGIIFAKLNVVISSGTSIILSGIDWHGEVDSFGSSLEYTK
jgi:hypothetical protein